MPNQKNHFLKYLILCNIAWLLTITSLCILNFLSEKNGLVEIAKETAKATYNQNLLYRRWVTNHGGVYVPVSEATPPNPYLAHLKYRDIISPSGQSLTLVNPAYMTRQVYELTPKQNFVKSHITSLKPINPKNSPDSWEKDALKQFEKGKIEVYDSSPLGINTQFRYMHALPVEEECLKCHKQQGYKVGDIRGGISVTIPFNQVHAHTKMIVWSYILLYLAGFLGLNFGGRVILRQRKKQAELENRSTRTLQATKTGLWEWPNIAKTDQWWSEEVYQLFGFTQNEIPASNSSLMKLVHPEDRPRIRKILDKHFSLKTPYHSEFRIKTKHGEYHWFDCKGQCEWDKNDVPIRMSGTLHNIDQRKRAEDMFEIAFQKVPMPMAITFIETGEFIDINQQFIQSTGFTKKKCIGKTSLEVGYIDVYSRKKILNELKEKGHVSGMELEFTKANGVPLHCLYNGEIIIINNKKRLLSIMHDTSETKQIEKQKEILQNQLNQAQKMEAIGTLAGGIAHDFNNILGAILGYAEMAKDDCQPGTRVASDLNKVLEAGNRAKELVQQILAFSRQSNTKCIPIQPAGIVREVIKLLRPSLPTTIEINQNIASTTSLILADPTQIHQVIMNFGTNAFQAMEETGGKLNFSLKEVILSSEDLVHQAAIEAGNFIQISICDSGPGIAPDIKSKIFDPYFTTKGTGKGTGMGLSIVHGIVKSYGGFILLYSELGKGTTFHVFLPVIENDALTEIEVIEQIPIGRERILFIDDEEILTEMGKDILERLGYHVTVRQNSLEALEIFQNQPDQFDLIITDQTMPEMTGSDMARRMLQIRHDIPIILCTGYSTVISEEKAKSLGIKEFALKPLSKKDLAVLIRKVLDNS